MKIAVVTDSTAYLTPQEAGESNYGSADSTGDRRPELSRRRRHYDLEEFYDKLAHSKSFPSTSRHRSVFDGNLSKLADEGYDAVISIHLTKAISGLLNTITQIAQDMQDTIKIIPFDSHLTVKMMGYLALEAAQLAQAGDDLDDI